jgi:hypothetical protein
MDFKHLNLPQEIEVFFSTLSEQQRVSAFVSALTLYARRALSREVLSSRASAKVERALKKIINHNENCEGNFDKIFINGNSIRSFESVGHSAIKRILLTEKWMEIVEKHHKKHNLKSNHNIRKAVRNAHKKEH